MTERGCVQVTRVRLPAGLRAWATVGSEGDLMVRVSASLPAEAQHRAVLQAVHAARGSGVPQLAAAVPAAVPAAAGASASAVRRMALHPMAAFTGSAVAGVAAMIMTAILTTGPVAGPDAASQPGPVPVIPAPHHHRKRHEQPGTRSAPSARPGGGASRQAPPSGHRSASPAPSGAASPRPPATSPAGFTPGPVPTAAPQPQPSASSQPASSPAPPKGGPACIKIPPLELCLRAA